LAEAAGVSERFLAQLEAGEGNISIIRLHHVADALGTAASALLTEAEGHRSSDGGGGVVSLLGLRGAGKSTVGRALAGERVDDPVVRALADTVRRYTVPRGTIDAILAGVRMDLDQDRYTTFAELEEYCRRVATAVGVAAIHIWGFTDPAAVAVAHDVGLAFQLTNILRDIPEDLARGRVYLPVEDFRACGCTVDDLIAGRIGAGFAKLAALECDRAAACFARGERLDRMLTTDGRLAWRAMFGVYGALFAAVRRAGPAIFTARVRPPRARLLAALGATLLAGPRRRWAA
jgi:phytoene/squalene synthetase